MSKAVVLLSGGLDSTTCLALACESYKAGNVTALNMYYRQRHDKEMQCAKNVAQYYGARYIELDISQVMRFSNSAMLKGGQDIPEESYDVQLQKQDGKPVATYVPFRNGLLLSIASAVAVSIGASVVMYGAHKDDAAGAAYPDCSPAFCNYMDKAIAEGTGGQVRLIAPFIGKTKADIVRAGLKMGVPYEMTWSCYKGEKKPCGVCGTCRDRIKAFELNGVVDPLMKGENNE